MMTKRSIYHRRDILKGLGAAAAVLPILPSLTARAATTYPKRLILMFSPNGTIADSWAPTGTETNFKLSPILEPLGNYTPPTGGPPINFIPKLLVLGGLDEVLKGPGDDHQKGIGQLWTATELQSGGDFGGGDGGSVGWGGGISVDQHIANKIYTGTGLKSLQLGVRIPNATVWTRMCYQGAGQPIPPIVSPYEAFDLYFKGLTPSGNNNNAAMEALRLRRKSVLDAVHKDFARLKQYLSAGDKTKLEAHETAIREIEQRLLAPITPTAKCEAPTVGSKLDVQSQKNYPTIGKLQMDLITTAFACNMTQVASLQWTHSTSDLAFEWLGHSNDDRHHELSHNYQDAAAKKKLVEINRWYAEQMAYLLWRLDSIPEGTGTMLDNTVVVWGNELGPGDHQRQQMPFVMAGSCGGYFRTGRYLNYSGTAAHSDLLVSICNAMGVPATTFGNPAFCNGPLKNLV